MSAGKTSLNGTTSALAESLEIPEAWATPAPAVATADAGGADKGKDASAKAGGDAKKDAKVKVENSTPFVALYQSPNGILAWPGGTALNGLGNLPSALPTVPLSSFGNLPTLANNGTNSSLTQATLSMLNTYQTGQAAAMMRFQNAAANMFGGTMKRFNRTPVACVVCHKAKSTCDSNRPCARCSRLGKAHLCKDRPHKKKGRPPKKRVSSETDNTESQKAKRKATVKAESIPISAQSSSNELLKSVFADTTANGTGGLAAAVGMVAGVKSTSSSTGAAAMDSFDSILENAFNNRMDTTKDVVGSIAKARTPDTLAAPPKAKDAKSSGSGDATASGVTDFAHVAESVDRYLWDEVIDDMSSFFIKHPEALSNELAALYAGSNSRGTGTPFQTSVMDLPAGTQVLSPLFCIYLTYMSYYLNPDQFTALQKRLGVLGVIIPNLYSCPIRKFDTSIAKGVKDIKAIAPVFRFRWCRKKPSVGITKELNFPMATLKVSFYRSSNPRTFLLFIRVNDEFEKVFGYKQSEVVRMSTKPFYYRLIHPKDWKKQLSLEMSMLLNKRRRFNTFIQCLCKWKEEICCLETFQFHFNNQDLLTHFTITFSPLPKYLFEKDTKSKTPVGPAAPPAKPASKNAAAPTPKVPTAAPASVPIAVATATAPATAGATPVVAAAPLATNVFAAINGVGSPPLLPQASVVVKKEPIASESLTDTSKGDSKTTTSFL
uniref:Zn(2)-C6 fungal-type domain-containing protein n=1 Tax=Lotharella globosa TaxID=91324 RepID=A0A6V3PSM4_9EUKA|mmetsp:Transcript_2638/g.5230  ORF Transcript_2638/g.5230 Transcript_2638/m.5230 type:complete len:718 (+) Transcript_2638:96-2249(+)